LLLHRIRGLNISRKEVSKMAYTIACEDAGVTCPYVAQGETEEEVIQNATKHVKEVHGFTDEQLSAPEFLEETKKIIKKT